LIHEHKIQPAIFVKIRRLYVVLSHQGRQKGQVGFRIPVGCSPIDSYWAGRDVVRIPILIQVGKASSTVSSIITPAATIRESKRSAPEDLGSTGNMTGQNVNPAVVVGVPVNDKLHRAVT